MFRLTAVPCLLQGFIEGFRCPPYLDEASPLPFFKSLGSWRRSRFRFMNFRDLFAQSSELIIRTSESVDSFLEVAQVERNVEAISCSLQSSFKLPVLSV